jgi:diguanylate cyclase (GGDEF)-like protein
VRDDHDRLVHSVRHDSLTGLLNRFGLVECLSERLDRRRNDFSVLYLDVDRFKSINDTLGHSAGDSLLATIGRRLDHVVGARGDVARIGGDEFVVVVDETSSVDARSLADRLSRSVVEPVEINGRLLRVSASIGVATGPWSERSAIIVLEHANQALHRAKQGGRDRIEIFSIDMRNEETRRVRAEAELRRGLDRGDVRPFFVPEFDTLSRRLIGAQIVPRWIRDDGTICGETELITLARDANTVERLTAALIREARPFLRRLELLGLPPDFRFRVELPRRCTPRAWRDGQIAAAFHDVDLGRLTLDVTAGIVAVDPENARRVLADLRDRGARICVRHVGDLATLDGLPVGEIRITGDLVEGHRSVDVAVRHALADLAGRLGLLLSADGVSTADDAVRLTAEGFHRHQGPVVGPPMATEEFQVAVENELVRHLIEPSVT